METYEQELRNCGSQIAVLFLFSTQSADLRCNAWVWLEGSGLDISTPNTSLHYHGRNSPSTEIRRDKVAMSSGPIFVTRFMLGDRQWLEVQ